jgi:hypothetical protein
MLTHTPRLYISLDTSVKTGIASIRSLARLQRGGTSAASRPPGAPLGTINDRSVHIVPARSDRPEGALRALRPDVARAP